MAKGNVEEKTTEQEENEGRKEKTEKELMELSESGEIPEVEFENSDEQVDDSDSPIEVNGTKYTRDELIELVSKGQNADKLAKEMQADYTRKTQKVAEERKELDSRIESLKQRAGADDVVKDTLNILEEQKREIENLKRQDSERAEELKRESTRMRLAQMKADAETKYGQKFSDAEFGDMLNMVSNANPYEVFFLMKGVKETKVPPKQVDKAQNTDGISEQFSSDIRYHARKMGVDPERVERFL